jgi:dihydroorotase
MPNLVPPVVTGARPRPTATASLPRCRKAHGFTPLMTLYLTEGTDPDDVAARPCRGHRDGGQALPRRGHDQLPSGVRDFDKVRGVLERMAEIGLPLCVHGEVTDPTVDIFDREAVFIDRVLDPIAARPGLRVVMEHITTADGVDYARRAGPTLPRRSPRIT